MRVSESDLVRFALRHVLVKLSPLHDPSTKGVSLLPVFVEFGDELTTYFDLDEDRLEYILNTGAEEGMQVEIEDIGLLLMAGLEQTRLYARLAQLTSEHIDRDLVLEEFKRYMYDKYLYKQLA